LLRNVTDVFFESIEIWVKRTAIQKDIAAARLKLSRQYAHQSAFAATARAHHANQFAASQCERDSFEPGVATAEMVRQFADFKRANDIALFLDDALGKIAAQKLADVDFDRVAVFERMCRSYRRVANQDRPVGFNNFQLTDSFVVVAKN